MTPPRARDLREALDPERFRKDAHAVVDRLADYLSDALARRGGAVLPWRDPAELVAATPGFREEPSDEVRSVVDQLLASSLRIHDPRTMGHQDSVVLPAAALGAFVASLVNNDPSVYETGPAVVAMEEALLRWMAGELGLPQGFSGVFTSGGSLGNLTALLAARQAKAGHDAWTEGAAAGEPLCVLTSEQTHYCIARAVQIMGWGAGGCLPVSVDDRLRLRADLLPDALAEARRRGRRVVGVVGSACTTASSSFDPLEPIADFCEEHDLWMHVDGAHGAGAVLSPRYRGLVAGIERADSVVWDGHKMMMMPSAMTAVLFRDGRSSYQSFRQQATYLFEDRPEDEWYNPGNRTVECTKAPMATRFYLALRLHGVGLFRSYVTRQFDLARDFARLLRRADDFELAVEPDGNIVCFRYEPPGPPSDDALQSAIRERLLREGPYYVTQADLFGRSWLRCSIMHPETTLEDLESLLDVVRGVAAELGRAR